MEWRYFTEPEAMAEVAAELVTHQARQAVAARNLFSLVLAGGSTPLPLYRLLAAPPWHERMPWAATHLFQGDERCLPPDHPESNFGRINASLLTPSQLPPAHIHRMAGELPPSQGAAEYRRQLATFGHDFDLILLGMGTDGHVASLFPYSPLLAAEEELVAAVEEPAGAPPVPRLTLTLTAINRAATVIIMATGEQKAAIAAEIRHAPQRAADKYPAARVKPREQLWWLISENG